MSNTKYLPPDGELAISTKLGYSFPKGMSKTFQPQKKIHLAAERASSYEHCKATQQTISFQREHSLDQGWANFSVQGPHSKFHNFIGLHSILIKITDI